MAVKKDKGAIRNWIDWLAPRVTIVANTIGALFFGLLLVSRDAIIQFCIQDLKRKLNKTVATIYLLLKKSGKFELGGLFISSVAFLYEGRVNIENKYNQDNGLAAKNNGMFDMMVASLSLLSSVSSAFYKALSPGITSKAVALVYISNAWVSGQNLLHTFEEEVRVPNAAAVARQKDNFLRRSMKF